MWKLFTQQLWELQQVKVLWKCFYTRKYYTLADWNHILSIRTYWGGKIQQQTSTQKCFQNKYFNIVATEQNCSLWNGWGWKYPWKPPSPTLPCSGRVSYGRLLRAAHLTSWFFTHFPRTRPICILQKSGNKHWWPGLWICYSVRFIGTSSLSIYLGIYWLMPTAAAVQGSREILGSFKDLFPKSQWNHEEWVLLDGLHKAHAQSGHMCECSFLVQFHGSVLSFFLQFCESQPLGVCRAAQGHCFDGKISSNVHLMSLDTMLKILLKSISGQ